MPILHPPLLGIPAVVHLKHNKNYIKIPGSPNDHYRRQKRYSWLVCCNKRIGPLCCIVLLGLLVTCNELSYYQIICYYYFTALAEKTLLKPLINSLCLLIERTTIDHLYLWVIARLRSRRPERLSCFKEEADVLGLKTS
jgi:hypothetical protein